MTDISLERTLPHNLEAERSILGAVLLHAPALYDCSRLNASDFYMESHRRIFNAMIDLSNREVLIDLVTIKAELQRTNNLEAVGGAAYLASLTDGLPRGLAVPHYVDIVKDSSNKRILLSLSHQASIAIYQDEESFGDIVDRLQMDILKLQASAEKSGGWRTASDLIIEAFREIEAIASRSGSMLGINTGFRDLNKFIQGLIPGDLIVLAGRPAHGKTTLAMNISSNVVLHSKKKVGIFTMEMTALQIIKRALFAEAMVDSFRANTGFLTKDDWAKLSRAAGEISETSLFVEETAGLTITQLRSKAQALKITHGVDLLVVDYLQLMNGSPEARKSGRVAEISEISKGLKNLAKELGIPILALSQLSRKIEEDRNRKPMLSDLRESGSIEQDSDIVLFI